MRSSIPRPLPTATPSPRATPYTSVWSRDVGGGRIVCTESVRADTLTPGDAVWDHESDALARVVEADDDGRHVTVELSLASGGRATRHFHANTLVAVDVTSTA